MTTLSGGCLCGAVRFAADDVETHYHACHCGMCRRWSGGAPFFATEARALRFTGEEHVQRYTSSSWAERGFCRTCGTHLFYFLKPAGTYALSVGTFDDQAAFRLAREICIDRKPDGYALAGDRPRLTEAEAFAQFTPP
jgi:hypothetical protein